MKTVSAFPLQNCAKLWRYFINVDKKVLRNEIWKVFPLTDVMRQKRIFFPSRDKSWQRNLTGFWLYLMEGGVHVSLQKQRGELLQKRVRRGSYKHKQGANYGELGSP